MEESRGREERRCEEERFQAVRKGAVRRRRNEKEGLGGRQEMKEE